MWLFSRSTSTEFHKCPRNGYYRYIYGGQGIAPTGINVHLLQGTIGHEGLAALALREDPTVVIPRAAKAVKELLLQNPSWYEEDLGAELLEHKAGEWALLTEGLLWAAKRFVFPFLLENYRIVKVEESAFYRFPENPSLILLAKPDLLLEPLTECVPPGLTYLEWKLFTPSKGWDRQYQRNPQAWSAALTNPEIENFIVCGLDKGIMRDGKRLSPFTYAYRHESGQWSYETERKKGWVKTSLSAYSRMEKWVNEMPLTLVQEQFQFTQPIPIDRDLMERWRKQQFREQQGYAEAQQTFAEVSEEMQYLDLYFPQWLDRCTPPGHEPPCAFNHICHRGADPLKSGFYQVRTPHHDLEQQFLENKKVWPLQES